MLKDLARRVVPRPPKKPSAPAPPPPIQKYLDGGCIPWSEGYPEFKTQYIARVLDDAELMNRFKNAAPLPAGYGERLDERVVEYPWVLARLAESPGRLLDAGATLIFPYLLERPLLRLKTIVVYTLLPETWVCIQPNVSYLYGDLRETILKGELFQEIVCISTLDHIGMDNTLAYSNEEQHRENKPGDYRVVVRELRRLLVPGGKLLLTVPFGKHQLLQWMQQFDWEMIQDVIETFGGVLVESSFFKYAPEGWSKSAVEACADCTYFDVRHQAACDPDYAAAARAVACLELRKP